MKTISETKKALNAIRKVIDADIIDVDIAIQKNKMLKLTQLIGLSAEAKASAKRLLHLREIEVLRTIDSKTPPSKALKEISAKCYEEVELLEYSDRINSALIHSIDAIRSIISLHKVELENSLKQ